MVRYLFYTIGDLTYQSPLVCSNSKSVLLVTISSWIYHFTEKLVWSEVNKSSVCIF